MKYLVGCKWGELKEETRLWFIAGCTCIDAVTCSDVEEGDCIVDLDFNLSISGRVEDDEIIIKDDAVIYNPSDEFLDIEIDNDLDNVLTVTEAAEMWGLTEGAIRNSIKNRKFILGIDYRKAGRITLITKRSMERIYGELEE